MADSITDQKIHADETLQHERDRHAKARIANHEI